MHKQVYSSVFHIYEGFAALLWLKVECEQFWSQYINKPSLVLVTIDAVALLKVSDTVKSFIFVGHLILCISGVGQFTSLRS